MRWCRTRRGLPRLRLLLHSRHFSDLPGQTGRSAGNPGVCVPPTFPHSCRDSVCGSDTGPRTPHCVTQKELHGALFSSPAGSGVLQRVTTGGPPTEASSLALTWLRLSGCAALVPPRCARYPVGVMQHPEAWPLTEATGLVLVLRRPKRGRASVSYEETWLGDTGGASEGSTQRDQPR